MFWPCDEAGKLEELLLFGRLGNHKDLDRGEESLVYHMNVAVLFASVSVIVPLPIQYSANG